MGQRAGGGGAEDLLGGGAIGSGGEWQLKPRGQVEIIREPIEGLCPRKGGKIIEGGWGVWEGNTSDWIGSLHTCGPL